MDSTQKKIEIIPYTATIPSIDLKKIEGHTCSQIPSFTIKNHVLEELSADYYQTKADGTPDYVEYSAEDEKNEDNQYIVDETGVKKTLPFLAYKYANNIVDITFDADKNTFTAYLNLKVCLAEMVEIATGNVVTYTDRMLDNKNFEVRAKNTTPQDQANLDKLQSQINSVLNKDGYYFSPKNCEKEGGCTCKIYFVFNMSMTQKNTVADRYIRAEINLLELSERQNTKFWAFYSVLKGEKSSPVRILVDASGTVITHGGELQKFEYHEEAINVSAHECGHLYGYPDEYFVKGGAVHTMYIDKKTLLVDVKMAEPPNDWKRDITGNLMNRASPNKLPVMPEYYLNVYKNIFEQKTKLLWEIKK